MRFRLQEVLILSLSCMWKVLRPFYSQENRRLHSSHAKEDLHKQIHACQKINQGRKPVRDRFYPTPIRQPPSQAWKWHPKINNSQHDTCWDLPEQRFRRCRKAEFPCSTMDAIKQGPDQEYAQVIPRTPFTTVAFIYSRHEPRGYASMCCEVVLHNSPQICWHFVPSADNLQPHENHWLLKPEPVPALIMCFLWRRPVPFRDFVE